MAELLDLVRAYALPGAASGPVAFSQTGRLRLARGNPWKHFTARQTISPDPPGFNWQARVRLLPLIGIRVTDSLDNGVGLGEVRMFGLPLARDSGPQLAKAQLTRWLAELPWCPGILHSPLIQWTAEGSILTAQAALGDARAEVRFDVADDGRIMRSRAIRGMRVGKSYVMTPWEGTFAGETAAAGLRVPKSAAVTWKMPEGDFLCWEGELADFRPVAT